MKKLTAFILAIVLALPMIALCSCGDNNQDELQADEQEKVDYTVTLNDDVFTYEVLTTETVAIVGFKGDHTPHTVTLPSTVGERTVVRIAENAFYYQNNVSAVIIPDTVTSIGALAFAGCSNLKSVTFSAGLTVIEQGAFEASGLTALSFPSSSKLTTIGAQAFAACEALASVAFPASLVEIGDAAFEGCTALTAVTLPANLVSVGTLAFRNCSALASLTVPANVTAIGDYAFNGTALTIDNVKMTAGSAAESFFNDASKFFND